jgi:hypothetical protein
MHYKYDAMTVTATNYNTKVSVEIPSDASLDELLDAFHSVAISMGYLEESWRTVILDAADSYNEDARFNEPHMRMVELPVDEQLNPQEC